MTKTAQGPVRPERKNWEYTGVTRQSIGNEGGRAGGKSSDLWVSKTVDNQRDVNL